MNIFNMIYFCIIYLTFTSNKWSKTFKYYSFISFHLASNNCAAVLGPSGSASGLASLAIAIVHL